MRISDQIVVLVVSFALAFLLAKVWRQHKQTALMKAGLAAVAAFVIGRVLGLF